MRLSSGKRRRITLLTLFISAAAWAVLLFNPSSLLTVTHCPVTEAGASLTSLRMLLAMNPVSALAAGWGLMLIAMMVPTLIAPLRYLVERSFKRRRARSVALFLIGYAALWMTAGMILIAVVLGLNLLLPQSYVPAIGVGIITLLWQCSPVKQRSLNRGHHHPELAAFGIVADLDALRFGLAHGIWCVVSCWALMLLPMLFGQGHFAAMAAATYVMISERLEPPRPLAWRLRFPGKLLRIAFSQFQIWRRKNVISFRKIFFRAA